MKIGKNARLNVPSDIPAKGRNTQASKGALLLTIGKSLTQDIPEALRAP